jgi:hypothetical protein
MPSGRGAHALHRLGGRRARHGSARALFLATGGGLGKYFFHGGSHHVADGVFNRCLPPSVVCHRADGVDGGSNPAGSLRQTSDYERGCARL